MDRTTEKGHSGVQVHSRGPIFPCVIARIETSRHGRYFPSGVLCLTTWELTAGDGSRMEFATYDECYRHGVGAAIAYNQRRLEKVASDFVTVLDAEMTRVRAQEMAREFEAAMERYDTMRQRQVESMLEHFKYEDQKIGFKDRPHSETGGQPTDRTRSGGPR